MIVYRQALDILDEFDLDAVARLAMRDLGAAQLARVAIARQRKFRHWVPFDAKQVVVCRHGSIDVVNLEPEVQQAHAFAWNEAQLGKVINVILDQPVEGEKNVWIGRSQADAPDVDGLIFVTGDRIKLKAGDIVPVEIVAMQDYDLVGLAADKPLKRQQPGKILSLAKL